MTMACCRRSSRHRRRRRRSRRRRRGRRRRWPRWRPSLRVSLARLASAVYFVIAELASLHPLYRHDLHTTSTSLRVSSTMTTPTPTPPPTTTTPTTPTAAAAAAAGQSGSLSSSSGCSQWCSRAHPARGGASPALALALAHAPAAAGDASPLRSFWRRLRTSFRVGAGAADAALRGAPSPPPPASVRSSRRRVRRFPAPLRGGGATLGGRRCARRRPCTHPSRWLRRRRRRRRACPARRGGTGGWNLLKNATWCRSGFLASRSTGALVRPAEAADADGGADDAGAVPVVDAAHLDFRVFLTMELSEASAATCPPGCSRCAARSSPSRRPGSAPPSPPRSMRRARGWSVRRRSARGCTSSSPRRTRRC